MKNNNKYEKILESTEGGVVLSCSSTSSSSNHEIIVLMNKDITNLVSAVSVMIKNNYRLSGGITQCVGYQTYTYIDEKNGEKVKINSYFFMATLIDIDIVKKKEC